MRAAGECAAVRAAGEWVARGVALGPSRSEQAAACFADALVADPRSYRAARELGLAMLTHAPLREAVALLRQSSKSATTSAGTASAPISSASSRRMTRGSGTAGRLPRRLPPRRRASGSATSVVTTSYCYYSSSTAMQRQRRCMYRILTTVYYGTLYQSAKDQEPRRRSIYNYILLYERRWVYTVCGTVPLL